MSANASAAAMPRHALGLPAGSVRALLAFGVLALSWGIVLGYRQDQPLPLVFVYLQVLMVLIIASFFAAHGKSIGHQVSTRSPLGMPRGSIRFLLLGGYAGLAFFLYYNERDFEIPAKGQAGLVMLILLSGFFLGHIISRMMRTVGGGVEPAWFQDLQAWLSLIALIVMAVVATVHLFINPAIEPSRQLDVPTLEAILSGVVGFYFGSRS